MLHFSRRQNNFHLLFFSLMSVFTHLVKTLNFWLAFSGLDGGNSKLGKPRFLADIDPNYLPQGPSKSYCKVEKLMGALYL